VYSKGGHHGQDLDGEDAGAGGASVFVAETEEAVVAGVDVSISSGWRKSWSRSSHLLLPQLAVSFEVGNYIARSNRNDHLLNIPRLPRLIDNVKARIAFLFYRGDCDVGELNRLVVVFNLFSTGGAELFRVLVIPARYCVDVVTSLVAVHVVVEYDRGVDLASECDCGGQTCRSSADDGDVDGSHLRVRIFREDFKLKAS
jgi:hypothetical protein